MRLRVPEPKSKLDAMTGYSFSTPVWDGGRWVAPVVAGVTATARIVDGPEDQPRSAPVRWDAIDWRAQEGQVRRLRQRIFTAAQEQDWPKVRNLQKLMLRSRANTLVSVRQVTQRNAGRKTAGIDGEVALTPGARARVSVRVKQSIVEWRNGAVRHVRPSPHARLSLVVPDQVHDPGLAEGRRFRYGQGVRADRVGNSPGRRHFTMPAERRAARA